MKILEDVEDGYRRINNLPKQAFTLIKIGVIVSNHIGGDKPLEFIERGIKIAKKINDSFLLQLGLNHKGNILMNIKRYNEALHTFKEYETLKNPDNDNFLANKINIGICYLNLKQDKIALKYILTALKQLPANTYHQKYVHSDVSEILVKYYIEKQDYVNANKFLILTQKFYRYNDINRLTFYNYQIEKGRNNIKSAFFYLEKYRIYEYSLKINENKNKIEGIKSQLALKEQTEKLQRTELEKFRSENERQNQFRWLFIALSIIGLLTTIYIFRTNKKLKKNNQELLAKNAEISAALLQGQTIERKRVAADLHDSLGSTMSSLIYTVNAIDTNNLDNDEKNVYLHLKQMLDTAYNEIRLLSHNLLPEEFEKQGLAEALKYFVRKINQTKAIHFDLSIDPQLGRLSPKIEFELYSISLELINNILKHSKATQAKISLSKVTPPLGVGGLGLLLIIADNGRGFFDNDSDGKGMKNVKARVESLNGSWQYDSKPNSGTSSTISIPI